MLATRVISALILLPIVVGLVILGGWPFLISVALLSSLAAYEFNRLMRLGGFQPPLVFALALV
jgi:CDP-diglyceride synthetase